MQKPNVIDLYSDYLIVNQGQATATGLSALLNNEIKHDTITRWLSSRDYTSKDLWKQAKPLVKQIATSDAVFIVDDTVEAKPYTDQNDLICWHYDHCLGRSIKGVNQLTSLYYSNNVSVPVGYSLITKPNIVTNPKTGKQKRVSTVSKHTLFQQLITQAICNQMTFKYILADSWFCSTENINFIAQRNLSFIFPIKSNRKVYLSESDKALGLHQPTESLALEEDRCLLVWLEGVDFPLSITRQLFKNEDANEAVLYLVSNDLAADAASIKTYYAKRWKIEIFHKSIKSNLGYPNSPTHTVRTQSNHLFLSMVAFIKLETLNIPIKSNHFALKKKLSLNALKLAWKELQNLKENSLSIIYA
jgi:DDE superfamily endonuclease